MREGLEDISCTTLPFTEYSTGGFIAEAVFKHTRVVTGVAAVSLLSHVLFFSPLYTLCLYM